METCENCGRTIGKLETPHIVDYHVVCAECQQRLNAAKRAAPVIPPRDYSYLRHSDGSFTGPRDAGPRDAAGETKAMHDSLKFWARVILYGLLAVAVGRILAASN